MTQPLIKRSKIEVGENSDQAVISGKRKEEIGM
jgi:hypothetical protein